MDLYESTRKRKSERIFLVLHEGVERKKRKENETKKINFLSPSSRGVEIHFSFSLSLHSLNLIAPTELTNHAVANISEIVNRNEPAMTT